MRESQSARALATHGEAHPPYSYCHQPARVEIAAGSRAAAAVSAITRRMVGMRHIAAAHDVAKLAEDILENRHRPLVLISTTGDGSFAFDPDLIAREVGTDADVITIATGEATYSLEHALPEKSHVFGGAARSYPADFGADPDWRRSILRFPDRHTADELIEDALSQVVERSVVAPAVRRTWVAATVERVSGASGNIAKLANGERVMVVADNLPPYLSLADALVEGGPVEGWLTERDLAPEIADADFSRFDDGASTLARAVKVTPQRAYLKLHPSGPEIPLRRRDVIPGSDDGENSEVQVPDVVRVGQTLRVRVIRTGATLGLSLVDVDADAALVAPLSLLRGGAPWLREGIDAVATHAAQTAPPDVAATTSPGESSGIEPISTAGTDVQASPAPSSVDSTALTELRDEVRELRGAFARLGRELRAGTDLETLDNLRDESAGLSSELHRERSLRRERDTIIAGLRQELRDARAARPEPTEGKHTHHSAWPSGEDWLRYEVLTTWANRTIASDKSRHPLTDYTVGPRFIESLSTLDDGQLDKALRAVIDVLTGRVAEIPGRQLHRLREGDGGSDPYVIRPDGASCWRASIEVNAPSARRLHYWQLPGGAIELSRVVLHDDMTP